MRTKAISLLVTAAALGTLALIAAIPGTAGAQAVVCTPVADAVLLPGYAVNIRPEPNTNGAPVGGIRDQTPRPVEGQSGTWLKLCGSGWVAGQYFGVTPRPTATPTRVVVIQTATPTRISGTPQGGAVWLCHHGVCHECPLPCVVTVRGEP